MQADSSANPEGVDADSIAALLSQLGVGADDLGGAGSEEELNGLLESMMGQLMSKEVLYEPLKELHDKVCPSIVGS